MADIEAGSAAAPTTERMTRADIARQHAAGTMLLKLAQGGSKIYGAWTGDDMDLDDLDDFDFDEDIDHVEDLQEGDEELDLCSVFGGTAGSLAAPGAAAIGAAVLASAGPRNTISTQQQSSSSQISGTANAKSIPQSINPPKQQQLIPEATREKARAAVDPAPNTKSSVTQHPSSGPKPQGAPLINNFTLLKSSSQTSKTSGAIDNASTSDTTRLPAVPQVSTQPQAVRAASKSNATSSTTKTLTSEKLPAKVNPLAPTPAAPFGFKAVKVKKPDGTIVTVKRPLTAEEAQKIEEQKKTVAARRASVKPTTQATTEPIQAATAPKTGSPAVKGSSDTRQIKINEKEIGGPIEPLTEATPVQPVPGTSATFYRVTQLMNFLAWAVMILFPLLFLGLAIAVAVLTNKPAKGRAYKAADFSKDFKKTDPLGQARDVAVSMWPIVFAAIVAQTLRAFAAFKVERGIPLVTLEQLATSNSLAGAIKQPFLLRKINWTTIILFSVWALSPLAGQAIVRMGGLDPRPVNVTDRIFYFVPQQFPYYQMELNKEISYDPKAFADIDAMYSALLVAHNTSRNGPQDPWYNVKIPSFAANRDAIASGSWMDMDWHNYTEIDSKTGSKHDVSEIVYAQEGYKYGSIAFAGLSGIPVSFNASIEERGIYDELNFNATTSQFVLSCTPPAMQEITADFKTRMNFTISKGQTLYVSAEENLHLAAGAEQVTIDAYDGPGSNGTIHFGSAVQNSSTWDPSTGNVTQMWYSRCDYRQELIRSKIVCSSAGYLTCYVSAQRRVDADDYSTTTFQPLGRNLVQMMALSGGSDVISNLKTDNMNAAATLTELYIENPSFALEPDLNKQNGIKEVTTMQLSHRLGELVNTLWLIGTNHKAILGGDIMDIKILDSQNYPKVLSEKVVFPLNGYQDFYITHWAWCVTLMVCSVLLLAASAAAIILERRTIGPDFLGFANTAIRKGVKLPKHMSNLSARDRLHALSEAEVLLQDVRPTDTRGRIALGINDEGAVRLVKGRAYR